MSINEDGRPAQCDELATVELGYVTTLAPVDVPWRKCRKVGKFGVRDRIPEGSAVICGSAKIPV